MAIIFIMLLLAGVPLSAHATASKKCISLKKEISADIVYAKSTISSIKKEIKGKKCLSVAQLLTIRKQTATVAKYNLQIRKIRSSQKNFKCKVTNKIVFHIPTLPIKCVPTHASLTQCNSVLNKATYIAQLATTDCNNAKQSAVAQSEVCQEIGCPPGIPPCINFLQDIVSYRQALHEEYVGVTQAITSCPSEFFSNAQNDLTNVYNYCTSLYTDYCG